MYLIYVLEPSQTIWRPDLIFYQKWIRGEMSPLAHLTMGVDCTLSRTGLSPTRERPYQPKR